MDLREVFTTALKLFFLLLLVFISYQVLSAILGGTWETENTLIAGLGIIFAGIFTIAGFLINQNRTLGIIEERTKHIGESLTKLGQDFRTHISDN